MTAITTRSETDGQRTSAPYVVVSCDTHIGPRLAEDLRPYCPEDLLEPFDAYGGELQERREAAAAAKGRVSFGGKQMGADWGVRLDNLQTPGHFDMHARMDDLDNDGVAAEVVFHDSQNGEPIPFQTDTLLLRSANINQDFEQLRAGQRIYNQWLADVCAVRAGAPYRPDALAHVGHRGSHRRAPVGAIRRAEGNQLPDPEAFPRALQLTELGSVLLCMRGPGGHACATMAGRAPVVGRTLVRCPSPSSKSR